MKERIELHQSQKDSAFSPQLVWEKNMGIKNIFKTRKESTKNHVDSCYYTILLERSFHSEAVTGSVLQKKLLLKISQISQVNICVRVSFDRSSHCRCSVEKVLLKCFHISQEHTCVGVSLIKPVKTFIKKRLQHRCLPVKFAKNLKTTASFH